MSSPRGICVHCNKITSWRRDRGRPICLTCSKDPEQLELFRQPAWRPARAVAAIGERKK